MNWYQLITHDWRLFIRYSPFSDRTSWGNGKLSHVSLWYNAMLIDFVAQGYPHLLHHLLHHDCHGCIHLNHNPILLCYLRLCVFVCKVRRRRTHKRKTWWSSGSPARTGNGNWCGNWLGFDHRFPDHRPHILLPKAQVSKKKLPGTLFGTQKLPGSAGVAWFDSTFYCWLQHWVDMMSNKWVWGVSECKTNPYPTRKFANI